MQFSQIRGEEPNWVYEQVEVLKNYRTKQGTQGANILVRMLTDENGNQVKLGDQLIASDTPDGPRFASIPAFIKHLNLFDKNGHVQGKGRRQCTREFKTSVVEKTIRRELLGLGYREHFKGPRITQVIGFDRSEGDRIFKIKGRFASGTLSVGDFPLFDL